MKYATVGSVAVALTSLALLLAQAGCKDDSAGDDDTTPPTVTPTPSPPPESSPTPTPSPTPAPEFGGEFRVTSFLIAEADTGFDLDGDGDQDNVLPTVFETLYDALEEAIYKAFTAASSDDPEGKTEAAMQRLEDYGLVFDADTINANTTAAIDSAQLNYLLELSGAPTAATLAWYDGWKNGQGDFVASDSLGSQDGTVDGAGQGTVGPGTFLYQPVASSGTPVLSLSVIAAQSSFTLIPGAQGDPNAGLQNGLLGGAIPWSEFEAKLRDALELLETLGVPIDADSVISEIVARLDSAGLLDVTVDGEEAFSCAFVYVAPFTDFAGLTE